jgi:hypothetical protein
MDNVIEFPNSKPPENKYFRYVETEFNREYEMGMRTLTRDVDPEKEAQNLPADRLIYVFMTVGKTTGYALEAGWASGRRDVHACLDLAYVDVSASVVRDRAALINNLKEKYHDNGFECEEYEGGFREFAQNFERATGRSCPHAIVALCDGASRKAA